MEEKKLAFDIPQGDWRVTAEYVDNGEALITFYHKGTEYRKINYPAYKIWNIPAHLGDIIADFDEGMAEASSDGLGGSAGYQEATQ